MTNAVIAFEVPGIPIPKGRPRFGNGRAYTPAKTRRYEDSVSSYAMQSYRGEPLTGAVKLTVSAYFPKPKKPKSTEHITRPDLTNIVKAVEDGCNEICYRDDSQIVQILAFKFYDVTPRVVVEISSLDRDRGRAAA